MLRSLSMYSPETQTRLRELRGKIADNTHTPAEMREAVRLMQEDRLAAQSAATPKRKTAKKTATAEPARTASDILKKLSMSKQ